MIYTGALLLKLQKEENILTESPSMIFITIKLSSVLMKGGGNIRMVDQEIIVRRLTHMDEYNVIVHDYIRIKPEIVYAVLSKNLKDMIDFAAIIKEKYLS
jgi:uncharacterized protein YprB with RNaseH-like and TPR domain